MLKFRFLMPQSEQRLHVVDFISAVLPRKTFKVPLTLLNFLCLTLLYAVRFVEDRWCDRPAATSPLLSLHNDYVEYQSPKLFIRGFFA